MASDSGPSFSEFFEDVFNLFFYVREKSFFLRLQNVFFCCEVELDELQAPI